MRRRPAKVLEPDGVRLLLRHVREGRHALRNEVMVLLSFKAGLRACEMSGLEWQSVIGSDGKVGASLHIPRSIAKMGSERQLPLHADLRTALIRLHRHRGHPIDGHVICSQRGENLTAQSIVNWFREVYAELGLIGCSSHSGRRTFITRAARIIAKTGGSLRDVQDLAGHRSIATTERYIQNDREAQRRLISLL